MTPLQDRANGKFEKELRRWWLARAAMRQCGRCHYCGVHMVAASPFTRSQRADTLTLDHIMPLSLGGRDIEENTLAACAACNQAKGNMLPEDWVWWLIEFMPRHAFMVEDDWLARVKQQHEIRSEEAFLNGEPCYHEQCRDGRRAHVNRKWIEV